LIVTPGGANEPPSRSRCSLIKDNLGRFNIIGLATIQKAEITMKMCHVAALVLAG